jgi:SAM-dependent methyltransferase
MMATGMNDLNKLYDDRFYDAQMSGSYRSAKVYAELLSTFFTLDSVADVGCGRGAWLKAFKERGAKNLVGFDGDWNAQGNMIEDDITFVQCDLNRPIKMAENDKKFDLAMSLEVAEHLLPSSAETFVGSLTALSDVVLFGAAFTGQGGRNHVNERAPTYWAALFSSRTYVPFDLFRSAVWGNQDVEFWYQQNTFLYARRESPSYAAILSKGASPISNVAFMDCVHPSLYYRKLL